MAAPTVVLVHGAFADSSSWTGVIERLQAADVPVVAPANPLRGVTTDSAYLANVLQELSGPAVVVGHSYGGAVISNAAAQAPNVVALVFVAAFAPEEGEKLGDVTGTSKDAILGTALVQHDYDGNVELSIDPAKFHEAFAADLPAGQAAVMAATQRPIGAAGVLGRVGGRGVEEAAVLGGRRHRRQGGRHRPHPFDGRAGRREDHRGRRLARGDGFSTPDRGGRDPRSRGRD